MSEEGEIRSFNITGEAAKAYSGGVKKKRVTRKRGGEEDGNIVNNTNNANVNNANVNNANVNNVNNMNNVNVNMNNSNNNNANNNNTNKTNHVINLSNIVSTPTTISRQNAPVEAPRPVIQDGGDDKKIKVELKKKQDTKKVQLHPKKDGPQKVPIPKKLETRKKNRKVLLGISSLHKRMTRAKKMHKKVKEMPLDKLREELISKKLIRSTSKAPESVLRQIATDAQIVDSKSL
jgi:hypothetical protein